jgi:hypothetical protein
MHSMFNDTGTHQKLLCRVSVVRMTASPSDRGKRTSMQQIYAEDDPSPGVQNVSHHLLRWQIDTKPKAIPGNTKK